MEGHIRNWASACKGVLLLSALLSSFQGAAGWPGGQYGLPMSKTGCPQAVGFNWLTGRRTHHTEMGSHGSESIHLAGIYEHDTNQITQSFCMKLDPVQSGDYYWEPGRYCIYKKNQCPEGFKIGWVYWDDAAPFFSNSFQDISGEMPDGEYDRNTKINFCCRNDGMVNHPITLPSSTHFHLIKWGDACQMVKGMQVSEEYVYWNDESMVNLNAVGGLYPKVHRSKYPVRFTKMYYCYYSPKPASNTFGKLLLALYVIAGTIGAIIILLPLLWFCQRLFSRKPKEGEENNLANAMRERVLRRSMTGAATEPVVVHYRPHPDPHIANGGPAGAMTANGTTGPTAPMARNTQVQMPEKQPLPAGGAPVVVLPTSGSEDSALSASMTMSDEQTPMLSPDDGTGTGPRAPTQPPSYEDVLREDGLV